MPIERKQLTALAKRLRKAQADIEAEPLGSARVVWQAGVLEQVRYVAGVLELLAGDETPEPETPEPHLGEQLKRKCLTLAVECVTTFPGFPAGVDRAALTPIEDHVCRFLERAMLAYGNITGALAVADAAARAPARPLAAYVDLDAAARASKRAQPDTSAARKVLGEVATLLQRVEVMQRDGCDATPEKLELLGKALLMLEERITLHEDETSQRLAVLERAFGVAK
jgi:hypothetical protein